MPNTEIILVLGPPCSGKSTYVAQQKAADELVFDFDEVARVLTGAAQSHGDKPLHVRAYVLALRDAFVRKAQWNVGLGIGYPQRVWIIACTEEGILRTLPATRIRMNTPKEVCLQRASQRSDDQRRIVEQWFDGHPEVVECLG